MEYLNIYHFLYEIMDTTENAPINCLVSFDISVSINGDTFAV